MKTPDLDKAFPKTPSYVHHCVLAAFEEGERRADAQKRRRATLCGIAAVLLVFIMGGIALHGRLEPTPDGRLSALSGNPSASALASPTPAAQATVFPENEDNPTPVTKIMDFEGVEHIALYASGRESCLAETDASRTDLPSLLAETFDSRVELTDYISKSFVAPLQLDITYAAENSESAPQTTVVFLSWNSDLELFELDGRYWALENGLGALLDALDLDEQTINEALDGTVVYNVFDVTPEPTATPAFAEVTPTPAPTESAALFALEDIKDLTCARLIISGATIASWEDPEELNILETLLTNASEIAEASCPFSPQLELTRADGTVIIVEPAYDACPIIRLGDRYYDLGLDDANGLWGLFGLSDSEIFTILLEYGIDNELVALTLPDSSYYHISDECNALSMELEAYAMLTHENLLFNEYNGHINGVLITTRSDCEARSLTPCAYCATSVFCAPGDFFYHADAACAHSSVTLPLSEAMEERFACPLCLGGDSDIYNSMGMQMVLHCNESALYHKNLSCPTALAELAKCVFPEESDRGLSELLYSEEEAAQKARLSPCPYCAETVYATKNGRWYHALPDCSGMMNALSLTPLEAEQLGKPACPLCLDGDGSTIVQPAESTPVPTVESNISIN